MQSYMYVYVDICIQMSPYICIHKNILMHICISFDPIKNIKKHLPTYRKQWKADIREVHCHLKSEIDKTIWDNLRQHLRQLPLNKLSRTTNTSKDISNCCWRLLFRKGRSSCWSWLLLLLRVTFTHCDFIAWQIIKDGKGC